MAGDHLRTFMKVGTWHWELLKGYFPDAPMVRRRADNYKKLGQVSVFAAKGARVRHNPRRGTAADRDDGTRSVFKNRRSIL